MNQISEKIDYKELAKQGREFNITDIHYIITNTGAIVMSWGFRNPVIMVENRVYRFTVSGHHHKGHVYIVLNGLDLFDIYYTSNRGTIKKISNDVYIDSLVNTLDSDIERISEYSF